MSTQDKLIAKYRKVTTDEQTLMQWAAIEAEPLRKTSFVEGSRRAGIVAENGNPFTQALFSKCSKSLQAKALLVEAHRWGPPTINDGIMDFVYRDARKNELLLEHERKICMQQEFGYTQYIERRTFRRLRYAFYEGNTGEWNVHLRNLDYVPNFIDPFCPKAFDELIPEFKAVHFRQIVNRFIAFDVPELSLKELSGVEDIMRGFLTEQPHVSGALLDLYISRGDVESIKKLAEQSTLFNLEADACVEFLVGNYEIALEAFDAALRALRKRTKKRTDIFQGFPLLLYALLLLKQNNSASYNSLNSIFKKREHRDATYDFFDHFGEMVALGMDCQKQPTLRAPYRHHTERPEFKWNYFQECGSRSGSIRKMNCKSSIRMSRQRLLHLSKKARTGLLQN